MTRPLLVAARNARFQLWQALLVNRKKRAKAGVFVVQGVRPITLALAHGWPVVEVLVDAARADRLSSWAVAAVERASGSSSGGGGGEIVHVGSSLLAELGGKDDGDAPELVLVVAMPADDLGRIPVGSGEGGGDGSEEVLGAPFLGVVFDRPSSPGNIGTVLRSIDAFGGSGLIVSGHAADPYDPQAVRASTGSLFAVPAVRAGGPAEVVAWARDAVPDVQVVGTDERGEVDLPACGLTGPTLLLVGNETSGLSAAWRDACDVMVRIPIGGAASSLNAAVATSIVLYEACRQRNG